MRKGQTKRVWTPEQKSEIVHKHLDDHVSVRTLEREYTADRSMICRWVKEYIAEGESAFIPKGHSRGFSLVQPTEIKIFFLLIVRTRPL